MTGTVPPRLRPLGLGCRMAQNKCLGNGTTVPAGSMADRCCRSCRAMYRREVSAREQYGHYPV